MFPLFGFVEAAKFRDSGEFSDCVQNLHGAERPRNEFRLEVLGNDVGSGSREKCQQETTLKTKGK